MKGPKELRLAVYQPDIAPNLGAMIRICACFGVPLEIIEPCGFALSAKTLRRAAMDYTANADLQRHDSWDDFVHDRPPGRLILLTTAAKDTLWQVRFKAGDTILMGRETAGVPAEVQAECDVLARIPMPGGGRSLNVAVAAGIALAEGLRQTRNPDRETGQS